MAAGTSLKDNRPSFPINFLNFQLVFLKFLAEIMGSRLSFYFFFLFQGSVQESLRKVSSSATQGPLALLTHSF